MSRIRYYKSNGKRYYVIGVPGFKIDPRKSDIRAASGGYRVTTTYAVLDRDWCHREMAVFEPGAGRRTTAWAKRKAEEYAAQLNASERLA